MKTTVIVCSTGRTLAVSRTNQLKVSSHGYKDTPKCYGYTIGVIVDGEQYKNLIARFIHNFVTPKHFIMAAAEILPVINLNTLTSSAHLTPVIISEKKEMVNVTTVDIANQIITAIKEGMINPLEFAVKKKLVVDAFEMAMKDKDVKYLIENEIEKYGKEGATILGAKLGITNRPSYKYDQDPTWASLKAGMADQEAALKEQEKKIQAACKVGASIVDDDGVILASVVPAPVTTSVSVSFKRK